MPRGYILVLLLIAAATPATAEKLSTGESVPSVALVTLDDDALDLAGFRGRVVLAKFGFTW